MSMNCIWLWCLFGDRITAELCYTLNTHTIINEGSSWHFVSTGIEVNKRTNFFHILQTRAIAFFFYYKSHSLDDQSMGVGSFYIFGKKRHQKHWVGSKDQPCLETVSWSLCGILKIKTMFWNTSHFSIIFTSFSNLFKYPANIRFFHPLSFSGQFIFKKQKGERFPVIKIAYIKRKEACLWLRAQVSTRY